MSILVSGKITCPNSGLFFNVGLLLGLLQQVSGDGVSIQNRLFSSKHMKMNSMQESSKTTFALREVVVFGSV